MGRVIKVHDRNVNIFDVQDLLDNLRDIIGDEAYFYLSDEYSTQEETIEDLNAEIFDLQDQLESYENE